MSKDESAFKAYGPSEGRLSNACSRPIDPHALGIYHGKSVSLPTNPAKHQSQSCLRLPIDIPLLAPEARASPSLTVCLIHHTPSPSHLPSPSCSSFSRASCSSPREGKSSRTAFTGDGMNARNSGSSENRSWNDRGLSGRPRGRDHCNTTRQRAERVGARQELTSLKTCTWVSEEAQQYGCHCGEETDAPPEKPREGPTWRAW